MVPGHLRFDLGFNDTTPQSAASTEISPQEPRNCSIETQCDALAGKAIDPPRNKNGSMTARVGKVCVSVEVVPYAPRRTKKGRTAVVNMKYDREV